MLNNQKKYLEDIENLCAILNKVDISTEKLEELSESIKQQEILLPVVGDFSAGKSSLLNNFLGLDKKVLPTDIKPETALATELRFDVNERVEAIKDDMIVKTYGINDFDEINAHATEYSYLKVYLNNDNLRTISPLVLVDMPGFESPVEAHNKAINIYLERGAYFVVLVSATDGTLHRSSFRHLNFFMECDRDFSIVVSKANLVAKENWDAIGEKIANQFEMELGAEKTPVFVGKDGIEGFKAIINNLDPESLFNKIVLPLYKNIIYDLKSSVNVKLSAIQRSGDQNNDVIENLKRSLERILKKEEQLIKEAKSAGVIDVQIGKIINKVGQDLSSNVDVLVSIAANQGNEALSNEVSDIVQGALLTSVQQSVDSMSSNIMSSLNIELKELNNTMEAYHFDADFVGSFSDKIKGTMENSLSYLNKVVETRKSVIDASKAYKAVTGVLAIATNVISPVLELAVVFLPEIIGFFKRNIEKKQQEAAERERIENIRTQILTQVIPSVKSKVKSSIIPVLQEQSQNLVEQITNEYEVLLQTKQAEIDQAEAERQANMEALNQKVAALEEAKQAVDGVYNSLF